MRILIITAPILSNFLATVKFARYLEKNNSVCYATSSPAYQSAVSRGFDAIELHTRPFINSEKKMNFCFRSQGVKKDYLIRSNEFKKVLQMCKPDLIFIDTFAGADLLFIKESSFKVKVVYLHPMLSLSAIQNYPRFNENFHETNKWIKRSLGENFVNLVRLLLKLIGYKFSITFSRIFKLGVNKVDYAKNKFIYHNLLIDETINVSLISKKIPQLVLAPSELEYSQTYINQNQYYLGLCIEEGRSDLDHPDFDFSHLLELREKYDEMVYISFGMFGKRRIDEDNIEKFIFSVLEVARQLPKILFIISTTINVEDRLHSEKIENLKRYNNVPQVKVLKLASVFICHGGLGSIKESIFTKTPLAICVLDSRFDQTGNASKIEFHGLGISLGEIQGVEPAHITEAITKLITDQRFKSKIDSFSYNINNKYDDEFWDVQIKASLDKGFEI